jgi:hypothetical protein
MNLGPSFNVTAPLQKKVRDDLKYVNLGVVQKDFFKCRELFVRTNNKTLI